MKDLIIEMYFDKQMKPVEIAKKLKIEKYTVTRILQKDARYLLEKERRKKLNQENHKAKTRECNNNRRKTNQLKNDVDDLVLKRMHDQASTLMSDHKGLSNMAYRDWNKSAFSYNNDKNRYEFREELGRSYDVPKYIKVEV